MYCFILIINCRLLLVGVLHRVQSTVSVYTLSLASPGKLSMFLLLYISVDFCYQNFLAIFWLQKELTGLNNYHYSSVI